MKEALTFNLSIKVSRSGKYQNREGNFTNLILIALYRHHLKRGQDVRFLVVTEPDLTLVLLKMTPVFLLMFQAWLDCRAVFITRLFRSL